MNIHPKMLKQLRDLYSPGTRVALVHMSDPYSSLKPGDEGVVTCVDDIGSIFVRWDNGEGLGIVFGEDSCRKIQEENGSQPIIGRYK